MCDEGCERDTSKLASCMRLFAATHDLRWRADLKRGTRNIGMTCQQSYDYHFEGCLPE